eukprot:TRINITY_DN4052_c0_g1_i1.p2 TRINITY_DN4052_c0_g1~~TRINITY_DN4052_c0_g1_i1.p2  ORF type:complete len:53 (-),score=10.27 TRINITY_DN4052_c0_g1_i1:355-513(-)
MKSDSLRQFSEALVQLVNNSDGDDVREHVLDLVECIFDNGHSDFFIQLTSLF